MAQDLGAKETEKDLQFVPMETPVSVSPRRALRLKKEHEFQQRGGALSLPFFDDFSTPSIPLADGSLTGYEAFQRWEVGSGRRTETYAIAGPTIGAATLEGLNRFGEPYNFVDVNTPDSFKQIRDKSRFGVRKI